MTLKEQFESTGGWLFRWRSHLPLLIVGLFLLALMTHDTGADGSEPFEFIDETVCLLVSFFGLAIRVVTIGHTPRGTSGRNTRQQVAETLNTTGIYAVVRNPLYLGNFFMGLGVAIFPGLWYLVLIYALAFWLYYERIIFAEEAFLKERFGDEYLRWANQTPAFIPRLRGWTSPALPFSMRNVLRREYNGFFAVIVVMFVLETAEDVLAQGRVELDPEWQIALGGGFLVWSVLRTLKKRTTVLSVAGR